MFRYCLSSVVCVFVCLYLCLSYWSWPHHLSQSFENFVYITHFKKVCFWNIVRFVLLSYCFFTIYHFIKLTGKIVVNYGELKLCLFVYLFIHILFLKWLNECMCDGLGKARYCCKLNILRLKIISKFPLL